MKQKTFSLKVADAKSDWLLIDAEGQTLGRLASVIATKLMGKDKPQYSPHVVCGDKIVVINSSKISVTGNKMTDKIYYHHSGYPGGIKDIALKDKLVQDPNSVLQHAIAGMLPKNKIAREMLKNLKIFPLAKHTHTAQNPKTVKVEV